MLKDKIKTLRLKNGLSQEEVSRIAGISYNTITKIEHGATENPRVKTILRIAKALGANVDSLINDDREE